MGLNRKPKNNSRENTEDLISMMLISLALKISRIHPKKADGLFTKE
jgi:hypothetical protein